MKVTTSRMFVLLSMLILWGCTEPKVQNSDVLVYTNEVDIEYGNDICSYSNEVIKTVRYGGKITMDDGTSHKFMSVECLAGFYLQLEDKESVERIELVDFAHGQRYMDPDDLIFLQSSLRPSPNGLSLTAIDDSNEKMKGYIYDAYPGTFMSWEEILDLVSTEWSISRK